jgi:adenylate cyclase class IV
MRVHLDEVERLGRFVEFETLVQGDHSAAIPSAIGFATCSACGTPSRSSDRIAIFSARAWV